MEDTKVEQYVTEKDTVETLEEIKGSEALDTIEDTKPGPFGVISGVLVVLGSDLDGRPVTDSEKELITALCAAGALVGAVVAGITSDKYGRKPAIWFASVLFTLGAIVQATSFTVAQMSVGRFLIGLGVGSASMIVPLYIAEISPARFRGRMISIDMIFLGTGSVLAYAFDAAFYKVEHGWRYMVGLGALPSILLGVFLFLCPESPRQLLFNGRREECVHVIRRIYSVATEEQVEAKVLAIERGVTEAKALNEEISIKASLGLLFKRPANRRAGIAACGLMFFQQFCGFNTLMYYSSTLFDIVGFSNPIAVGSVVAIVNWIFTVLSILLIDRIGRRRLLLWTMWGMPVCLVLAAIAFHWVPMDHKTLELTSDVVGWPAILVLVAMILFVAFYAAGLGCVPWQANEFLPMEVRSMGTMMINIFN
ncbi:myo-inositol transporter [Hortaea werneckii]|nr:myo-inositol transporter [Hortaea werneckii]